MLRQRCRSRGEIAREGRMMTEAPETAPSGLGDQVAARFRRRAVPSRHWPRRLRRRLQSALRPAVGHRLGPACRRSWPSWSAPSACCCSLQSLVSTATGWSAGTCAGRCSCWAPSVCRVSPLTDPAWLRPRRRRPALLSSISALADSDTRADRGRRLRSCLTLVVRLPVQGAAQPADPFDPLGDPGPVHARLRGAQGGRHGARARSLADSRLEVPLSWSISSTIWRWA